MIKHKGFTLIEVTLFLAVTAALFIGIALGMQSSIDRQRFDESTQEFFEFMRSIYSKVSNPQSPGKGNSNRAIYGKLVVFGETYNIDGSKITEGNPMFTYDVVGDVVGSQNLGTDSLNNMLSALRLELKSPEKFEMPWQTTVKNQDGTQFKGSLLVVRHPRSGTINTLYWGGVINHNMPGNTDTIRAKIRDFQPNLQINFCLSLYDKSGVIPERPIRILKNARNASDVELIDLDSEDNKCRR